MVLDSASRSRRLVARPGWGRAYSRRSNELTDSAVDLATMSPTRRQRSTPIGTSGR